MTVILFVDNNYQNNSQNNYQNNQNIENRKILLRNFFWRNKNFWNTAFIVLYLIAFANQIFYDPFLLCLQVAKHIERIE